MVGKGEGEWFGTDPTAVCSCVWLVSVIVWPVIVACDHFFGCMIVGRKGIDNNKPEVFALIFVLQHRLQSKEKRLRVRIRIKIFEEDTIAV